MKKLLFLHLFLVFFMSGSVTSSFAQNTSKDKLIIITLDGFRWQELFRGADPKLIANEKYVSDSTSLKQDFWRDSQQDRRSALMPFVWDTIVSEGVIHGNRGHGSKVNLTNEMWFSYPGYNEILTGEADDKRIDSNEKKYNPNVTILEKLNKTQKYKGKVAAFGSWDVFPYIINEKRSGVPVNAGFDTSRAAHPTKIEQFLNKSQPHTPSPWGYVRLDMFTHNYALEYMKRRQPDIVYIAYGETDDFAHDGNYHAYLNSAHSTDTFLKELWSYTQQSPYYKDKTTFIVTTDHGRGTMPIDDWKSHGSKVKGADEVWLMMYGNEIKSKGEILTNEELYSTQIVDKIEAILEME